MLYPFMTLLDATEISHSEIYMDHDKEYVRVEIEKPIEGGLASAQCLLPEYVWGEISGFTSEEIEKYQELIESLAHIIISLAREGGFDSASIFK